MRTPIANVNRARAGTRYRWRSHPRHAITHYPLTPLSCPYCPPILTMLAI